MIEISCEIAKKNVLCGDDYMTENFLPHWDVSTVYPGLDSQEFETGLQETIKEIRDLVESFDEYEIREQMDLPLEPSTVETFDEVVLQLNEVLDKVRTMRAYIHSFVSTNSRNNLAQEKWSIFQPEMVKLGILGTRFSAWVGSLDVEGLIAQSEQASEHAYYLRKAKIQSQHLMSPGEEELAAEMDLTGGSAWNKLYGNFTSQLMVPIDVQGESKELPMSAIRNLAHDPDREVRQEAFIAELNAWEKAAVPIAAAINSIKGQVNYLADRRSWGSALDLTLFQNNMDRETLDLMMEAARESFPDFRRYLTAKAKALGIPALAWFDLFAPVSGKGRTWSYQEAKTFILTNFEAYSTKLSTLAKRAFEENWIDAEPRSGKRDGAFCMGLRGDESRILSNFQASFDGVSTLAHELGHAYHNLALSSRTSLQRFTPMTLAETASIFCQTIIQDAALKDADPEDQFVILEGSIQDSCQVVVDISSRFIFEKAIFEQRKGRELSAEEFNELMLASQLETYGDGLDPEYLHPYMWAAKSHYYNPGLSFYNFPYMFGLLFGLGLYARYLDEPGQFKVDYDDLLSSTGLGDAAELAARFGIDLHQIDFWRGSLNVIRRDIDRFEALVEERVEADVVG
jgi:pepF/M3 family oligoendopeptidase